MILAVNIDQSMAHFGVVTQEGKLIRETRFNIRDWIASVGIPRHLLAELKKYRHQFPDIMQVGIGLPGILSPDRKTIVHVPHQMHLDNLPVADFLSEEFPEYIFKFERSGGCLALGEYALGKYTFDSFLLISLDACMESAAILEGKLFNGINGNGLHLANMLINEDQPLEKELRWNHLEEFIHEQLDKEINGRSMLAGKGLYPETVCEAARKGDRIAKSVFEHAGTILGKALVSVIPLLDVSNILLTGRLAIATDLMLPSLMPELKTHLASYYLNNLLILKATVGEKAGLVGAASLFK